MGASITEMRYVQYVTQTVKSARAREKKLIFVEEYKPSLRKTRIIEMFEKNPIKYRARHIKPPI